MKCSLTQFLWPYFYLRIHDPPSKIHLLWACGPVGFKDSPQGFHQSFNPKRPQRSAAQIPAGCWQNRPCHCSQTSSALQALAPLGLPVTPARAGVPRDGLYPSGLLLSTLISLQDFFPETQSLYSGSWLGLNSLNKTKACIEDGVGGMGSRFPLIYTCLKNQKHRYEVAV